VESLFQASAMAKRLYVGNLSYSVTSENLQELFEQYGTVASAQVLSDRETGRSRGFGFVEMDNDAEAEAAIENLDGNEHEGRRLTVNEARPRTPGGGGPRGGGGGRSNYGGGGGGYGRGGSFGEGNYGGGY
jgi:RNA recognition motif-containing protein